MKSYSVTFGYTQYLVLHSINDPKGKKTTIRLYLLTMAFRKDEVAQNNGYFLF
jgi:hypothetical protein